MAGRKLKYPFDRLEPLGPEYEITLHPSRNLAKAQARNLRAAACRYGARHGVTFGVRVKQGRAYLRRIK